MFPLSLTTQALTDTISPSNTQALHQTCWGGKRQHQPRHPRNLFAFPKLSPQASQANSFTDFPHSLMSVGKTADNKTVSIFTCDGITVHVEEDVLITCHGTPMLIATLPHSPYVQTHGQWQPRQPSKRAQAALHKANSVYDLPSTEQDIKWLHAVCGYPVKSTWMKAIKVGNFHGWPLLTATNVLKYYPETVKTPKGHLNQT
eukprot:CCRYP_002729-RA/>CCRYP_002729-RA protein AED:0.42 eAED:0.42 QI:0/0/0/1/0/0/3/0/201